MKGVAVKRFCVSHALRATILTGLAALTLSGCQTALLLNQKVQEHIPPIPTGRVLVTDAPKDLAAADQASQFAAMALFAKVAYRRDIPTDERISSAACSYATSTDNPPDFGMPKGWTRWAGGGDEACLATAGLSFEVYLHHLCGGRVDEAVIAYRGTENDKLNTILADWSSNLMRIFQEEPTEYREARTRLPATLAKLENSFPGVKIYATGHSLGGGLAQQAGYLSRSILEVFAFDPSPVTNWTTLHADSKYSASLVVDPVIHRVYHHNEALSLVRRVTTAFTFPSLRRTDYEFYFQSEEPVAAHEMGLLACHLAVAFQGEEAAHHYLKSEALRLTSERDYRQTNGDPHPICPPPVKSPQQASY